MTSSCILALDLGTTAFKAAPVDETGVRGRVTVTPYELDYLDYAEGRVTCNPERYVSCAWKALRGAARTAREQGLTVRAVGLSSQAQTYVALDERGQPVQPAVVWTDTQAVPEAEEAARALPDFARTCGFVRPNPMQFLPKVMRFRREGGQARWFVLLNEWVTYRLTGELYGDSTNQGMGGFYDITKQAWNERALALAGITADNLAAVAPAAARGACLTRLVCGALDLPAVPVYSCGNDQSCAAVGAGIEEEGDLFCNFGTALVVYALKSRPMEPSSEDQIAGISPLPGRWFLLGLESECGNVVEWLARLLYPRKGVDTMIEAALKAEEVPTALPQFALHGGGRLDIHDLSLGCRREELARALLEYYAAQFGALLAGVTAAGKPPRRLFAGGGLSRSAHWLELLGKRHHLTLQPTAGEHPGLVGVAKIIANRRG
ncbi:MAG TPA: FGGY family carbohydrate kinase [Chthonomonadaceae bacterium]|nr:FGGY family carbohydrate kinase [Chthonomonadaceae bacterium]